MSRDAQRMERVVRLGDGPIEGMIWVVSPLIQSFPQPLDESHHRNNAVTQPFRLLPVNPVHSDEDIVFACIVQVPGSRKPTAKSLPCVFGNDDETTAA
jgi:hypothetical protein